jgi:hypothetical protein
MSLMPLEASTVDGAGLHSTSDDQSDAITLAKAGGVITINGTATTQVASINTAITVDAGGGNDVVDASALIATDYATLTVHGGNGNDTLTGGANGDALSGDDGDDRLVGFKNPATSLDVLEGGAGDDAIVWNNGDGTDIADGGSDFDFVEVNGSSGDDEFTIAPGATGHVQFNRSAQRRDGRPSGSTARRSRSSRSTASAATTARPARPLQPLPRAWPSAAATAMTS